MLQRRLPLLFLSFLLMAGPMVSFNSQAEGLSNQLPDIGKVGARVLSPREEQQIGQEFMRSVRSGLNLLDDRPTTAYLQGLADRLASSLDEEHQPITVFWVNDPSINAFAGPGGFIGVHTGLLLSAQTEAELASVVAHEIAHVTQRHLVRSFQANQRMSLPTMGALIAALVLGASSPQIGEAVLATTLATSAQQQLTHSRSNEQEADNIGLEMLFNAQYNPTAMVAFFETLQNKQRLVESAAPEFMRTHPLTLSRIADARNRAEQYPPSPANDATYFQLMQARTAILTHTTPPEFATNTRNNLTTRQYLAALQAVEREQFNEARGILEALTKKNNHLVLFQYTAAQIELADNQPQKAHDLLKQTLAVFPGNLSVIELYVETLLRLEQAQEAKDLLSATLRKHPDQFYLYQPYAKAAAMLGQKSEAYRALAERQTAMGNLYQAVDYLRQALETPGLDTNDRLSMQARQDMLKQQIREHEEATAHEQEDQSDSHSPH
ncbi:M48 family metallopeptidase [Gammaproteobacteria bacterium AH-315-K14]|nr:M48 family metallopeptidase [Gammaproteobacteria bacterium AH-315-K14]